MLRPWFSPSTCDPHAAQPWLVKCCFIAEQGWTADELERPFAKVRKYPEHQWPWDICSPSVQGQVGLWALYFPHYTVPNWLDCLRLNVVSHYSIISSFSKPKWTIVTHCRRALLSHPWEHNKWQNLLQGSFSHCYFLFNLAEKSVHYIIIVLSH